MNIRVLHCCSAWQGHCFSSCAAADFMQCDALITMHAARISKEQIHNDHSNATRKVPDIVFAVQSSKQRPDVVDLLLHPFITAVLPPARTPTTAIETYPAAAAAAKQARHPGMLVSSFAIEAARRQVRDLQF